MAQSTFAPHVAVVTGAAQGIGLSIALRLADDGLDVAVNDISSKADQLEKLVSQIHAKGRNAMAVVADVSQEEEVKVMVAQVIERLGGLDIMVANAGIMLVKPLVETSAHEWDFLNGVNVRGIMLCYKYAAIEMIKRGRGGRILGASSINGKKGALDISAYSASKFAVRGLTQSAALELAPHKITVNAYAPGIIKSQMSDGFIAAYDKPQAELWQALGYPSSTEVAEPAVVASLVSYLAKPEAYFITGQTIGVNGGVILD